MFPMMDLKSFLNLAVMFTLMDLKLIGLISAPAQKIANISAEPGAQIARLLSSKSSNLTESN